MKIICIVLAALMQVCAVTNIKEDVKMEYALNEIAPGFSYGDIPEHVRDEMTGCSYPKDAKISIDELSYITVLHYDFSGSIKKGEMVVNKIVAAEVTNIFYQLYENKYPIHSIELIDKFDADDIKSMEANNTSAFNYRAVAGTSRLSNHAKGLAVDINPLQNPYVGKDKSVSPQAADVFADRQQDFKGKIDKKDLAYRLFKEAGWSWGGDWKTVKDYQHFEKNK